MSSTFSAVAAGGGGADGVAQADVWTVEYPAVAGYTVFPPLIDSDNWRARNQGSTETGWTVASMVLASVVSGGTSRDILLALGGLGPIPPAARIGGGVIGWLWGLDPVFQTDIPPATVTLSLPPTWRVWTFQVDFAWSAASAGNLDEGIYIAPRNPAGAFSVQNDAPASLSGNGGAQIASDPAGNVVLNWYTAGGGLIDSTIVGTVGSFSRLTFVIQSTRPGREPTVDVLDAAGAVIQARTFDGVDLPRYLADLGSPGYIWGWLNLQATSILARFRLSWGQFLPDGTAV